MGGERGGEPRARLLWRKERAIIARLAQIFRCATSACSGWQARGRARRARHIGKVSAVTCPKVTDGYLPFRNRNEALWIVDRGN
jgi:hypothetical protein